jgi:hypothetical protein
MFNVDLWIIFVLLFFVTVPLILKSYIDMINENK